MKKKILLATLISTKIFAFESTIHGDITQKAIATLNRCHISLNTKNTQQIAVGSVEEDTTQMPLRLTNWHFYNTYGNLRQGPILFESLDHIFKIRNEQLVENLNQKNNQIENSMGRVLHYIQDMYVPAHVVPVFHGKPFAKSDAFDQFSLSEIDKQNAISEIDCNEITELTQKILQKHEDASEHTIFALNNDLLKSSVQFTLQNINSRIEQQPVAWNYFWREPTSKTFNLFDTVATLVGMGVQAQRFGTYVGNFGKDTFVIDHQKNKIEISPDTYKKFYKNQYQHAVLASAEFILTNTQFK